MTEDSVLIQRLQNQDLDALGSLYDRHKRLVYRTALAITGDPEAAADLLQDVFLRLFRFVNSVDPDRPLEPWLYRMTANLAYTWIKRHQRWGISWEDLAEKFTMGRRPSPLAVVEARDEWQQVRQAVLSLPFSQRVVVVMYYINDLSLQEIAEVLNIPEGTVKSRLYYGRRALRDHLTKLQGGFVPDLQYEFT